MQSEIESKSQIHWPFFIVACAFVALTFAFAFFAFVKQDLSPDQRSILLRWALPISSALTSGLFAGSISVNGSLTNGLKVGAVGGFAVWLLSLLFLTQPQPQSQTLKVTQFNFLVESSAKTDGVNTLLTKLDRRSSRDYKIEKASDLKIAFGLVISGFKVTDTRGTKVRLTFSMLDESGKELVSSDVETFDTTSEWRDLPNAKAIGPENIIRDFELSESDIKAGLSMPIVVLLDSFKEEEIPKKSGVIRVRVRDEYSGTSIAYEEPVGFIRPNNR